MWRTAINKFFRKILNEGYEDAFRLINKEPNNYTFWDYKYGSFEKKTFLFVKQDNRKTVLSVTSAAMYVNCNLFLFSLIKEQIQ